MDNVQKIEDSLWEAAEKLRVDSGLKSTQYSTPLLGLVFLRFASINIIASKVVVMRNV